MKSTGFFTALLFPALLAVSLAARWSQGPHLPIARTEVQVARIGERLYVLGGFSARTDYESRVDVFDAKTGSWLRGPDLPQGGNHLAVAAGGGHIYVFGSCCASNDYSVDIAYALDVAKGHWTALRRPPLHCGAGAAAFLAGKVHISPGSCAVAPQTYHDVTTHLVYDPVSDKYTTAAPLPAARNHMCLVTAAGRLYAIGGRHETKAHETARVDIYDPVADRWTSGAPLPAKRSGAACETYKNSIFVIGGDAGTEQKQLPAHDDVFVYNTVRDAWSTWNALPHGLHGTDAARLRDRLYLPGGSVLGGHKLRLDTMFVSTPLSGV